MIPPAPGSQVLVVDDAEGSRHVYSSWLRRAGHVVFEAASGGEALELIAAHRLDLVVLDIHLPDMTGFEVCDHIKEGRATSSIPVLHVSATATGAADRINALNRGADGYLIEPIEREELVATASSLLRYHDARRTSERLATRLERLHQSTLLMNAASTPTELAQFAASGLASLFGVPAAVFIAREGNGRFGTDAPNQLEPRAQECAAGLVLELARAAEAGETLDLSRVADLPPELVSGPQLAAPIATPHGELVGAVLLRNEHGLTADELLLDHFGQALAVALENQRLYAIEHRIALTLQRAMLPQVIPRPEQVEIAVRYHAVSDTVEIGGDFYEVIQLDEHRTMLAVGDVVGHSLQAATVMAELRYSLRAFAAVGLDGAEILGRLADVLTESDPGYTATVCIAEIDARACTVQVTNAGHVPPILRREDGCSFVTDHGPLLGLRGLPGPPTISLPFPPGATIVMTTDGLIERRGEDLQLGLDRLRDALLAPSGPLEDLCERLIRDVGAGGDTLDDIAIVAARRVAP